MTVLVMLYIWWRCVWHVGNKIKTRGCIYLEKGNRVENNNSYHAYPFLLKQCMDYLSQNPLTSLTWLRKTKNSTNLRLNNSNLFLKIFYLVLIIKSFSQIQKSHVKELLIKVLILVSLEVNFQINFLYLELKK